MSRLRSNPCGLLRLAITREGNFSKSKDANILSTLKKNRLYGYLSRHEQFELMLTRGIILAISFVTIPIVLSNAGNEVFGVLSIITGLSSASSFTDSGIANGVISQIARLKSQANLSGIQQVVTNAFALLSILGLFFIILGFPISNNISWGSIFNLSDSTLGTFKYSVFLLFIGLGLGMMGSVSYKILLGLGKNRLYSRWMLLATLLSALTQLLFSQSANPLPGLVFGSLIVPQFVSLICLFTLLRHRPELSVTPSMVSKNYVIKFLKEGSIFSFLQISALLSYQIDSVIVGHLLTPEKVTMLNVSWKAFSLPLLFVSIAFIPLWAKTSELESKDNSINIWKLWAKPAKLICLFIFPASIGVVFLGKPAISAWTQGQVIPSTSLVFASATWLLLGSLMQPAGMIMNGLQSKRFLFFSATFFTVLDLFGSYFLVKLTGDPSGTLWANSIVAIPCFFLPFWIIYRSKKA